MQIERHDTKTLEEVVEDLINEDKVTIGINIDWWWIKNNVQAFYMKYQLIIIENV